jgi:tetratricopeptide (TPR) repeat protein
MGKREEWMEAVRKRLDRVAGAQNLSVVLEDSAVTEADELTSTLTDANDDLMARYLLGWLHWYRYQALPAGQDQSDLRGALTMFAPCFINAVRGLPGALLPILAGQAVPTAAKLLELTQSVDDEELLSAATDLWERIVTATAPDDPDGGMYLSNLGIALLTRFERTGALADLDNAIQVGQLAVQRTAADHPNHAGGLSNLGNALRARFDRTGAPGDLDGAVVALEQAVHATPASHPSHPTFLSNLGIALHARFERTGTPADLDSAIRALKQAVEATPAGQPNRAAYLYGLGNALRARFERTGAQGDLDGAIVALEQAVNATSADHPNHAMYLSNLGNALGNRFERTGAQGDLDGAINAHENATQATSVGHPNRSMYLTNLGNALWTRFRRTGVRADLDRAIACFGEAVQATPADHPSRAGRRSNLGNALWTRFERTGVQADLDRAIVYLREAAQDSPTHHPNHATILSNLGIALRARSERTGAEGDLDSAITALQEAVQATPASHPNHAIYLSNLGIALHARFDRTGAPGDLDGAITALKQAAQAIPADHPIKVGALSNLGAALQARFRRTGAQADLDSAIDALQWAVQATPADHPSRAGRLSNLGIALWSRLDRTGTQADLDSAIDALQSAVRITPADDPGRSICVSNLGISLLTRFRRTAALADLDGAIDTLHEAIQATATDQPLHATVLSNLGNALRARFERTAALADLDGAIDVLRQAVQATPADHPNRAAALTSLGIALQTRFERTEAAVDREAAFSMFAEAAGLGASPPSLRIGAGRAGASLAAMTDTGLAANLLKSAVLLLPEVAPRFLERGDQQHAIGRFAGLAADAAALALSDPAVPESERPGEALRLLEAARGVLLSQALSTRGDVSELREHHPEMAARFVELRDWLDNSAPAVDLALENLIGDRDADAVQATRDRRLADAEFDGLLADIRALDGFAAFGLPPAAEQLQAQAKQGPVVIFNVSSFRSDAIVLTDGGITSQRLPNVNPASVSSQVNAFHEALSTITGSVSPATRARGQEAFHQVLAWLWDNAAGPVLHTLGYRDQPLAGEPWPRVWWVPGGLLALLPIHAAGYHASPADSDHRAVIDRVISSYTPTVGALAHARGSAAVPGPTARSLIVAMPTTPDLHDEGRLKYVPAEAALVRRRLPNPTVLSEPSADRDPGDAQLPTRAAVLEHLPESTFAHFACHGSVDPADPSQNRLLLHDHDRNPLTVAALAPVVLEHAQLAYLSACSTARMANARLLDETIHLVSAFQLAGFSHVIGTLWEIDDAIAVEIADAFYGALVNPDGTLDPARAASAIHRATRTQRDRRPANPYLWASHIHAGA